MPVKHIDPSEAAALVAQGWRYVDVRSEPEFADGHPQGAYNVPIANAAPGRPMQPNPDFLAVFSAHFQPGDQVVLGCRSGARSARATELLLAQGFTNVVNMAGGFEGGPGVPGWRPRGLPTTTMLEAGRSYPELAAKK
jgi:rhodanese-related sulfurtransferase